MMIAARRPALVLAGLLVVLGCDERLNPTIGRSGPPPITAPTGEFTLRAVNDSALPHDATQTATTYSLVSGTFTLGSDSTWGFTSTEIVSSTSGTVIGTSPANYQGTWRVADTIITLSPDRGSMRAKGDTLFWRGAPRHTWEDTLTFTMVRKGS